MRKVIADSIISTTFGWHFHDQLRQDIINALEIEWNSAIDDIQDIVTEHYIVSTDPDYATKQDRGYGACAHSIRKKIAEYRKTGGSL
jgi:hypothetical protein